MRNARLPRPCENCPTAGSLEIRYAFGMSQSVKAAVFPVAGRGTRFLPVTKASPKEMLPIVDKPLIQYAVDEALSAGADTLIFITGSSKRAISIPFRQIEYSRARRLRLSVTRTGGTM